MAWTIKDIKKRIFDLETRKKSIKNPNKLFQIDQTIASLYEIIDYMSSEVIDSKYSIKRIVNDDRKYINAHLPYTSMVDGFATSYQDKETIIEFKPDYVQIADMSKDKALYILMDIIMNGTDKNIFNILKKYNINIGNNIVSYEQDMCLKLGI